MADKTFTELELARMLHDQLNQLLVTAKFDIDILRDQVRGKSPSRAVQDIDDLLDPSVETSRSLTVDLCPPVLYDAGLASALRWLAEWVYDDYALAVEVDLDEEVSPDAIEIRVPLFKAVRELLSNIVKHAKVSTAIVRMSRSGQDRVQITVQDAGSGFDLAGFLVKHGSPGGSGLSRIREYLRLLGGTLDIESLPGQGTRIVLTSPVVLATVHERETSPPFPGPPVVSTASGAPVAGPSAHPGGGIRILLADDHFVVRDSLARLLQMQPGIDVIGQASDGQMAVELARQLQPDVILMDVSMPQLDGIEATRRVVAESPCVRVIGFSMHHESDMAAAMLKAGAVGYLSKTANPDSLIAAIRTCVARQVDQV